MGALANIGAPEIYGLTCTRQEWETSLWRMIMAVLQDEEELGLPLDWTRLCRQFPQLTVREFVNACGQLADLTPGTGR